MTTHSSILDWEFHRQEPGGLQSLGSQRIGHGWATNTFSFSLQNCEKISFCCLSHQVYGTWLQQPQETNTSGSGHPPGCQSCGCLGRWVPLPLTRKTKTALPCNPTTTLAVFSYSCSLSFCSLPRILTQAHAWGTRPDTLPSYTTTKDNPDFLTGSGFSCLAPSSLTMNKSSPFLIFS